MKISAKMDYTVRALLELGLYWPNSKPYQLNDISRKAGVPKKFLIHILIELKNSGLVQSIRGKMGGYVLSLRPSDIKMGDIIKQLGGVGSLEDEKRKRKNDVVSLLWQNIDKSILESLKGITLEDLCIKQRQQIKTISYDI